VPSSRTRARDADRDALCRALDAAFAEGQLDGAEHRDRTATALKARTLGELRALVDDLQLADPPTLSEPPAPRRSPRRTARWVGLLASLALLGVGFGVGFGTGRGTAPTGPVPHDPQVAAAGGPVAEVAPRVVVLEGLHTPSGWARFVSDVRDRLGTTVVASAVVYPGYAVLTTPVAGNPAREERWHYQGGLDGPDSPSTRDASEPLVDLAAFSPEILMPLIAGAPESLAVPEAESVYVNVEDDGSGPQARIYASNQFNESGYLEARPDGSLISLRPHEPS
jgi:hypothetical protein